MQMAGSRNIAVVVLDTLRKDAFDSEFQWLRDRGVAYDNAWSTSHWTIPAHASLFTGHYPSEAGSYARSRSIDRDVPTLPELLANSGYRTRGISANPVIGPRFNHDRGFDAFTAITDFNWSDLVPDSSSVYQRYPIFLKNALGADASTWRILRETIKYKTRDWPDSGADAIHRQLERMTFDEPEFVFLNLMETHSPYDPPSEYQTGAPAHLNSFQATVRGQPDDGPEQVRQAYQDAVSYLSDKYREIHSRLTEVFDCVITVADHGESFGEYDCWGHTSVPTPETCQIPVVVSGQASNRAVETDQPVNLLDVFQTVCNLAGVTPPDDSKGVSLTECVPERELVVETHGMTVHEEGMADEFGLDSRERERFDERRYGACSDSGYAFETLASVETVGRVENPRDLIEAVSAEVSNIELDRSGREVSSALEDQLEALGYA